MLIIVEGPDGTGKTTLVRALRDHLGNEYNSDVEILKAGPPKRSALDEYVMPLLSYRPSWPSGFIGGRHVICDRWHLGELVYPQVLDRRSRMPDHVFRYVEMFLQSRGAVVVHVAEQSASDLERVLRERGDDLVKPEQAKLMIDLFYTATQRSVLPVIDVDPRDSSLSTVEMIATYASTHSRHAINLEPFVTYVGPHLPELLLVGDVRGGLPESHGLRPAFMPYMDSSGDYLMRAVGDHRYGTLGIANANDVDNIEQLWHKLGRPKAVSLGRNAERAMTHKIPSNFPVVPHPQYHRRFHHHAIEGYRQMIIGAHK